MAAIYKILPDIQRANARVMLMNDSFLLVQNAPELFDDKCGGVYGLVWTDTDSDPTRHIQSYIWSLSACEVDSFIGFYEQLKAVFITSMNSYNNLKLILVGQGVLFPLFTSMQVLTRIQTRHKRYELIHWKYSTLNVRMLHTISVHHSCHHTMLLWNNQKVLIPHGYPAIKLKKFFVTNDSWLSEDESSRTRLPPSFSAIIYKKMNHDFNHLSKDDLKNHFAEWGKTEGRIYSAKPLVIKDWIKDELMKMGDVGESAMLIFEDYLATLNSVICTIRENDKLVWESSLVYVIPFNPYLPWGVIRASDMFFCITWPLGVHFTSSKAYQWLPMVLWMCYESFRKKHKCYYHCSALLVARSVCQNGVIWGFLHCSNYTGIILMLQSIYHGQWYFGCVIV